MAGAARRTPDVIDTMGGDLEVPGAGHRRPQRKRVKTTRALESMRQQDDMDWEGENSSEKGWETTRMPQFALQPPTTRARKSGPPSNVRIMTLTRSWPSSRQYSSSNFKTQGPDGRGRRQNDGPVNPRALASARESQSSSQRAGAH
ncbi:hypothetical protein N657DRAFT_247795 [Parathielavia appendiculata]|uniref:Uncharacterized protein n=1 Tax=Parathielavia appendiculata TaxID=2587402 RepID=A0AAN6TS72_9PEZI|nr:hypothetical protein N657DRAFT_247795 [Parathielavia appendiculata]